jgi:hypothetical protein
VLVVWKGKLLKEDGVDRIAQQQLRERVLTGGIGAKAFYGDLGDIEQFIARQCRLVFLDLVFDPLEVKLAWSR